MGHGHQITKIRKEKEDNIKITTVGCGNAFSYKNFNQSFVLEETGNRLLIDCGTRTPLALKEAGIDLESIDAIYISHAHADHVGGLEEVAFLRYDWMNRPIHYSETEKPYAPKLIANEKLMTELWDHTLKGGLDSMEGFDANLETFFEPISVKGNQSFKWGGWTFDLVQQVHIMTGSVIKNTFGIMLSKKGHKTVYFTTDSQHCSPRQMEVFYQKADIILQDCECTGVKPNEKEFIFGSGVHANYGQLAGYESANSVKLSPEIKAKMWLSHYQDFVNEDMDFFGDYCDWEVKAERDGFAGFVQVGQEFEI